jgi:Cys-tRNA(Pro)/Cys-tRNA(Cys) deacylase
MINQVECSPAINRYGIPVITFLVDFQKRKFKVYIVICEKPACVLLYLSAGARGKTVIFSIMGITKMMTPATKFLDSNKIQYSMYKYECDAKTDFGHMAATKLGRDQNEVFKTLLIHHEKTYVTAVIPVNCNLNLKRAAKLAGLKNAEMVKPADAERLTGYVCGGISPFGQKKRTMTLVSDRALALKEMLVSGGQRGFSVGLPPDVLIKALDARTGDITDDQ